MHFNLQSANIAGSQMLSRRRQIMFLLQPAGVRIKTDIQEGVKFAGI
jgi:hypothetical protein